MKDEVSGKRLEDAGTGQAGERAGSGCGRRVKSQDGPGISERGVDKPPLGCYLEDTERGPRGRDECTETQVGDESIPQEVQLCLEL